MPARAVDHRDPGIDILRPYIKDRFRNRFPRLRPNHGAATDSGSQDNPVGRRAADVELSILKPQGVDFRPLRGVEISRFQGGGDALREKGYLLCFESPTNQIFCIMENEDLKRLREKVDCEFWEKYDDGHTVIRFATDWGTTESETSALVDFL